MNDNCRKQDLVLNQGLRSFACSEKKSVGFQWEKKPFFSFGLLSNIFSVLLACLRFLQRFEAAENKVLSVVVIAKPKLRYNA